MKKLFLIMQSLLIFFSTTFFFIILSTDIQAREASLEAKITSLYVSFFNRAADEAGLNYWNNAAKAAGDGGLGTLKQLAAGFAAHPSFKAAYGDMDNEAFVRAIYQNALGREGNPQGIAYWKNRLDSGTARSDMVAEFMNASLTVDLTPKAFPDLSQSELEDAVQRQNLISNKTRVGVFYTRTLGRQTNVADAQYPESDPAYLASIKILSNIDEDPSMVDAATNYLTSISSSTNPIQKILTEWNINSCIVNARYPDHDSSNRSVCIEDYPSSQCPSSTYTKDDHKTLSFMQPGKCTSLGYSRDNMTQKEDGEGILRDLYVQNELFPDESSAPIKKDWKEDADTVQGSIVLPDHSPLVMKNARVEVLFSKYTPDADGDVHLKIPKDQIINAYIMLDGTNDKSPCIYLFTTLLPGESDTDFSARATAVSMVLNGIDRELITQNKASPQEIKQIIAQNSSQFIQHVEKSLANDPCWLRTENLPAIYEDSMFVQALQNSREALQDLYNQNNGVVFFSAQGKIKDQLSVQPQAEQYDFLIRPERSNAGYFSSGDLNGNIVIENDTMLPARYRATNLFTKMPIHTPKGGLYGMFGDLIAPQSSLLYLFNASSTTVRTQFNRSKIIVYTPGWAYLPKDTPEYDYIKSMNRSLNMRLLLDQVVVVVGSLLPARDGQTVWKMMQWLSQQSFFRTALDQYYSYEGKPGDLKKAVSAILNGLMNWGNLNSLLETIFEECAENPEELLKTNAKWMGKLVSLKVGVWIYAADLASTELDLFSTPAYLVFEQVKFPVFLTNYDKQVARASMPDDRRKIHLAGQGLYEDGAEPFVKLKTKDKNDKVLFHTVPSSEIHRENGGVWFYMPHQWISVESDISESIYFQYNTSFQDNVTGNQVPVKIPFDFGSIREFNGFYKINIETSVQITEFSELSVSGGEELIIFGGGFAATYAENTIRFTDHEGKKVEVTPTFSSEKYLKTSVPEALAVGPLDIQVIVNDIHQSNHKSISLLPAPVTASPSNDRHVVHFKDSVMVSLSQEDNLDILYHTDAIDKVNALSYTGPLTLEETITLYPFARVTVDGINYDSSGIGYTYYKCAENEEFKDGECVSKEDDGQPGAGAWKNWPEPEVCPKQYDPSFKHVDGCSCSYYESGGLRAEQFLTKGKEIKRVGIWKEYSEFGQLRDETPYVNGVPHGVERVYYESGQLSYDLPYVNGNPHGISRSYTRSGCLEREVTYENGNPVSRREYDCLQ